MALDPNQEELLASLVNGLSTKAAETLSNLSGLQIKLEFLGQESEKTAGETIEAVEATVIAHASVAGAKLNIILAAKDAGSIANMVLGNPEPATEFPEEMHSPFITALTETLTACLADAKYAFDPASIAIQVLDPANPESMQLGELGGAPKHALAFGMGSESGHEIKLQAELPASLVLTLLPGGETVGDVMGAEFSEIVDDHNPDAVDEKHNLNLLMDIELGLIVELGRSKMHLRDILKLTKGS
ncbi:MAG: hypothetical protein OXU45_04765, partial [Candidatus Melainabacteria bacterium]|nr:hypothetical protein [Candidatus Melainabacteria bacterium]